MEHTFSQILRFPHKPMLARVIRTRGAKEGIEPVAKAIYDTHIKNVRPFRVAVRAFLDVCNTVDKVKQGVVGFDAPADTSNAVQTVIGQHLIKSGEWDGSDLEWVRQGSHLLTSTNESMSRWGRAKLYILANAMGHFDNTRQLVAEVYAPLTAEQLQQAETEYESTEAHLREIMDGLLELRRYGVKSSFTQRGFLPQANNAWVMWDYRDFGKPFGISSKGLLASVALSTAADEIKDLGIKPLDHAELQTRGFELPFPASFLWTMSNAGEFQISSGTSWSGVLGVREIFHAAGKDVHYQALRLQLVYHLYDLVVPVAKLATLPELPTMKAGPLAKLRKALDFVQRKKDPVVDFLVPRMKVLNDRIELIEAVEIELERSALETQRRAVRQHDVEDFIRPLPKGHRPSALARKRALEAFGVELADNETYVKAHRRGSGEAITAHRVRQNNKQ